MLLYSLCVMLVLIICSDNQVSPDVVIAISSTRQDSPQWSQASPCSVTSSSSDVTVDCTHRGIHRINPAWFPEDATQIFLDNNNITTVENFTFQNVSRLLVLSISYNNIDTLQGNAFRGLENLQVLNLEFNRIDITDIKSFPDFVLKSLKAIKELRLKQGLQIVSIAEYPLKYLDCQAALTNLSIDTINIEVYFGPEFLKFTNLTKLEFAGSAKYLTNETFINVRRIKELFITRLQMIDVISPDVFQPLQTLEVLHLEKVPYGVGRIFDLLWPFRGRTMTSVFLNMISYNFYANDASLLHNDSFVFRSMTKHLTSICLRSFTFTENQIFVVVDDAFYSTIWDSCLKEIDISSNPLTGTRIAMIKILTYTNLEILSIENLIRKRVDETFNWRQYFILNDVPNLESSLKYENESFEEESFVNKTIVEGWEVYMLKSLKVFNAKRMIQSTQFNEKIFMVRAKHLELIDLSDSGFSNFIEPVYGLTALKFLDLSSNQMSVVTENWFDYLPKLETLVLSNCQLDGNFMAKKSGRLFSKLKSLQRLDLSLNSLTILSEDMFVYNSQLKMLRLADNRFNVVPFNLKYTPNLTFLDLTNNALVTLDVETRQMFDQFAQGKEGFQLYLDGNILSCGCESLSFLQWLMSTNVTFDKGGIFSCMDQNGVVTITSTYRNLDVLWRKCWGEFFLQISLVVICLIIIGLLSTFVINKKLTYISHYVIQLFGGFKFQTASDYKTGVFIGYAENDYRFACHTLRSFVEDNLGMTSYLRDRDLLPSTDIARGIVEAINSSWRIVLVFNQTFLLNDDWMMFTFRSAIYAQTPANPNRVIVLVDEKHAYNLPTELLNAVVEDNIVVVHHWMMTYELKEKLRTLLSPKS
ncbi:toll-like receptor 4 [Physella acuta]|uniref:toll-like receptor 4 n=1 Tax=Physella acuta TaxID=109671 RepID=UPI0027DB1D62|nr:toll-like receptor 4 [Physella acuta]